MGLCFGFVLETVLVIQGYFSFAQSQGPSCSSPHPNSQGLGGQKRLGRDKAGTSDPHWAKGYPSPCGIIISSPHHMKLGEKEQGRIRVMAFVSLSHSWWSPALLGMAEHLPMGSGEQFLFCFSLECSFWFNFCLYLNPWVYAIFTLWFSPPSHCRGVRECLCGAELLFGVKPPQLPAQFNGIG